MQRHKSFMRTLLFVALLTLSASFLWAIQTGDVELGNSGNYDGTVRIKRAADGQLTFRDSALPSTVTLQSLMQGVSLHSLLSGLSSDDHSQYLNASRHGSAHTAIFNGAMLVPSDVAGNATLVSHLLDANIHPKRNETSEITGDWRFSGTPQIWKGLKLSALGAAGDSAINFKTSSSDAQIQWKDSENRFVLNRGLKAIGGAGVSDISTDGNITGVCYYGDSANARNRREIVQYEMDDNQANSIIKEEQNHYPATLSDPAGSSYTSSHSVPGVIGSALSFDGVDDSVNCGTFINDMITTASDFTISMWLRPDENKLGYCCALYTGNTTKGIRFSILNNTTGCWSISGLPGGTRYMIPSNTASTGQWAHHVLIRRGGVFEYYHNGIFKTSNTVAGNTNSLAFSSDPLLLGCKGTSLVKAVTIDQIRIYNHALSPGQVTALYATSLGTTISENYISELKGALSISKVGIGCEPTSNTLDVVGNCRFSGLVGIDGQRILGKLQVSGGAYCDGNTWVDVSTRKAKMGITPLDPADAWNLVDQVRVVEFQYRKRNPDFLKAGGDGDTLTLKAEKFLDEPEGEKHIGYIVEDLPPRLARTEGIAAIEMSALNTAVAKEMKRHVLELETRIEKLENANKELSERLGAIEKKLGQ